MSETSREQGISVAMQRTVRQGKERDYEVWLHAVIGEASRSPGHLGAEVVRPAPGGRTYLTLFRYDTLENLLAWEGSAVRSRCLAEVEALVEGPVVVQRATGLETWFALPGASPILPPPRWKMAIVTWCVAFPLIQGLNAGLGALLPQLPALARGAMAGAAMVLTLTYAAMPLVTRALAGWLYPGRR